MRGEPVIDTGVIGPLEMFKESRDLELVLPGPNGLFDVDDDRSEPRR